MLANSPLLSTQSGKLNPDVHLPATSRYELIEFIAGELPAWRDRDDRREQTSETALTSQLCGHLNSAARRTPGLDFLQFRIEEPDEQQKGRKIDLIPSACAATVWIEGRRHSDFDTILPIECKRLPTPIGQDRDEREYVVNRSGSTGGIQRFKAGHHGGAHSIGAMIAYVQAETTTIWGNRVAEWIQAMIESGQPGWTSADLLNLERHDLAQRMTIFRSVHSRTGIGDIELRHLWVTMN